MNKYGGIWVANNNYTAETLKGLLNEMYNRTDDESRVWLESIQYWYGRDNGKEYREMPSHLTTEVEDKVNAWIKAREQENRWDREHERGFYA